MSIIKTEAIVLKSDNYRGTSKIVTLYTEDIGKLRCIAKGVRDVRTKWGGVLQPMSYLDTVIYYKENRTLHLISSAEYKEPFLSLYDVFEKTGIGYRMLELVHRTTLEHHPNRNIFTLLKDSLASLNGADIPHSIICGERSGDAIPSIRRKILVSFEFRLADLLGVKVDLNSFSDRAACGKNVQRVHELSLAGNYNLTGALNSLKSWNFNLNTDFNISKEILTFLDDFFEDYFSAHFGHSYPSKTRKVIKHS